MEHALQGFGRDAFEASATPEKLCRDLEALLLPRLVAAADRMAEAYRIVDDLRRAGHELWCWDESLNFSTWGDDYANPSSATQFVLEMRWPSEDDPDGPAEVVVTFRPWPQEGATELPTSFIARYWPGFSLGPAAAWELHVGADDVPHFTWDRVGAPPTKRARRPRHPAPQPGLLSRLTGLIDRIRPADLDGQSRVDDAPRYEISLQRVHATVALTIVDWPDMLTALPEPTRTAAAALTSALAELAAESDKRMHGAPNSPEAG